MISYSLSHLDSLESESIDLLREVAAEFERPVLLFSGGKDSICMLRLAEKAFRPGRLPFPLLNIDTGHNFPELNEFRDRRAEELGAKLIVRTVEDAIAKGIAVEPPGEASRNRLQSPTLLDGIEEFKFDCVIEQTRRHAYISSLLRIPHLLICVNKMDLIDYSEKVFEQIHDEFTKFSTRIQVKDLSFIPISALKGDNVVDRWSRLNV